MAQDFLNPQHEYRQLPAVDALLHDPTVALLAAEYGQSAVTDTLRTLLATARRAIAAGEPAPPRTAWPALVATALAGQNTPSLRPVINATGVIIHTNLGRAPLSEAALTAMTSVAQGYSNLEYDLAAGTRGSRYDHARALLQALTGAEDGLVVNNNAAAVYLVLTALCQGRQVIISRGQLVEIGGGFRIPDVLRQSGAQLVEVGATNRTHLRDFSAAITPETAAIMRVHSSNFKQIGFVAMPTLAELAALVREQNVHRPTPLILIDDLGSGTLLETAPYGLAPEPTVPASVADGADVITFSGDKLLGGPQAGLILGRQPLIEQMRRHPMARALRVDKLTLAALDATLRSYQQGSALRTVPVWQMISATVTDLEARVGRWQAMLREHKLHAHVLPGDSAIGGGSLPGETLPTVLLALPQPQPDAVAARLRQQAPPIICRIQRDQLLFDPRTVLSTQESALVQGIIQASEANA
jgi:L-seryl-tRNA(Ser) seleniumtransferase